MTSSWATVIRVVFVFVYLQLNISYLSSFLDALLCFMINKVVFCLSVYSTYSAVRGSGRKNYNHNEEKDLSSVSLASYCPYSSMTNDCMGSPEGYPDTQSSNFNSSVKI